jgi:hypothetical protein
MGNGVILTEWIQKITRGRQSVRERRQPPIAVLPPMAEITSYTTAV